MAFDGKEILEEFVSAAALGREWFSPDDFQFVRGGAGSKAKGEHPMPLNEPKRCTRAGCQKKLRADNGKGVCSSLKRCGQNSSTAQHSGPPKANATDDTLRRFRMLAEALGMDADQVLADFAAGWLDRALKALAPAMATPPTKLAEVRIAEASR